MNSIFWFLETTYKVSGQYRPLQKVIPNDKAKLYLIIVGDNERTEKLFLSNDKKGPIESTAADIGKVCSILIDRLEIFIFKNRFQKFSLDKIRIHMVSFGMSKIYQSNEEMKQPCKISSVSHGWFNLPLNV